MSGHRTPSSGQRKCFSGAQAAEATWLLASNI